MQWSEHLPLNCNNSNTPSHNRNLTSPMATSKPTPYSNSKRSSRDRVDASMIMQLAWLTTVFNLQQSKPKWNWPPMVHRPCLTITFMYSKKKLPGPQMLLSKLSISVRKVLVLSISLHRSQLKLHQSSPLGSS